MHRRSLSNLLGGSLLVATVAALNACGGEAPGGETTTPSAGTTGTPSGNTAGSTGTAGKSSSTPSATATAGTKATAGTTSTTSGVSSAAGQSGSAGTTAAAAAGSTGAAGSGTAAAAGATASAAGSGAAGGAAAAGSTGGGMLGGALKYTGMFTMGMTVPPLNKCPMPAGGGTPGMNKSPKLAWTGGPAETKSFAVVLFDVGFNMLHWVLWDIPATVNELPEGIPSGYDISAPMGAHQATNPSMSSDVHGYWGPCSGGGLASMYEYRLYALSKDTLGLTASTSAADAQKAVEGAMLGMVAWTGKPGD